MSKPTPYVDRVLEKVSAQIRERASQAKLDRENAELHKTSAWFAEQARSTERAMDRKRWER